jgi:hypothetical protein
LCRKALFSNVALVWTPFVTNKQTNKQTNTVTVTTDHQTVPIYTFPTDHQSSPVYTFTTDHHPYPTYTFTADQHPSRTLEEVRVQHVGLFAGSADLRSFLAQESSQVAAFVSAGFAAVLGD